MKPFSTVIIALTFSFLGMSQTVPYNSCNIYTGSDPNTSLPVDALQLPRSMWVNNFIQYQQGTNIPSSDGILCYGNWNSSTSLYGSEETFLNYITNDYLNNGASVTRLLLYNISFILNPINNVSPPIVSSGPSSFTLEEHLARFIAVAKSQYNIEVEAVISGGTNSMTNGQNSYNFTLDNSTFLQQLDLFQISDPCLANPGKTSGKTNSFEPTDWIYFDETIHGTIYPIDTEGNLHPFDEIRKGIWNVRIFNSRNQELKTSLAAALAGFSEWQPTCLGFDRVIPEWEFWDANFAQLTTDTYTPAGTSSIQPIYKINDAWDGLLTLLDYARCSSGLLNECGYEVDAWINNFSSYADNGNPNPAYLMYDNNNVIIDPYTTSINKNMAHRIENLTNNIYVGAYKNTPCKAYYSSGSSSQRTFKYKVEQFNLTPINSKVIPVFNTKNQSNSMYDFLTKRTSSGDTFNGSFGKTETVFYDEYLANTPTNGWVDQLFGYSWYNREEAFSNAFYKTNNDPESISEEASIVFFFYPNPSNTNITIETNQLGKEIVVRNITGQLVFQSRIKTYKYDLPISQLTPGIYFMQVGDKTKKLTVN